MRISDWSSDVCSSDLCLRALLIFDEKHGRRIISLRNGIDFWQLITRFPISRGQKIILVDHLARDTQRTHDHCRGETGPILSCRSVIDDWSFLREQHVEKNAEPEHPLLRELRHNRAL